MSDAIVVDGVCKRFKRYQTHGHLSLKDMLAKGQVFRGRGPHEYIEALKNVTVSVPDGTVLGIIGTNGSGKSTLLRVLAGIYRPDAGRFSIRGRISALLSLGIGFHPDLTGRENVMIGGLSLGLSRGEVREAFDEIVEFGELQDFIEAPVRTYSSGMYARLAFSIAVHVEPDVLLLDEVLAVGDASFVKKSRARIDRFKEQGKTIVLVTHDLSTVRSWCHQVLWLNHGEVLALDEPAFVVRQYAKYASSLGDNTVGLTSADLAESLTPRGKKNAGRSVDLDDRGNTLCRGSDPHGYVSWSKPPAARATWTVLPRDEDVQYYYDPEAFAFTGDFDHFIDVCCTACTGVSFVSFWALTQDIDNLKDLHDTNRKYIECSFYRPSDGLCIRLDECDGVEQYSVSQTVTAGTIYYLRIWKDDDAGAARNGILYCDIYTAAATRNRDSDHLNYTHRLSLELHSQEDYRYLYRINNWNRPWAGMVMSGWSENLVTVPSFQCQSQL